MESDSAASLNYDAILQAIAVAIFDLAVDCSGSDFCAARTCAGDS